jgi:hypothetical protein
VRYTELNNGLQPAWLQTGIKFLWGLSLTCMVMVASMHIVRAQNLDLIGKQPPFKFSGGLSATSTFYAAQGIDPRRPFHNYFLSGNFNINIYGLSVPFTFTYSDMNSGFQQPFNQFGFSPTYKWVTVHMGFRSMTFSPYTLSGIPFFGGGLELAPKGIFRFSAMYGRLLRATTVDTTNSRGGNPNFERWGYGFKAGLVKGTDKVELIFFTAADRIGSLPFVPEALGVLPQENIAVGLNLSKTFFKRVALSAEWASTAITRDTRAPFDLSGPRTLFSILGGAYSPRTSTAFYNALKAGINYTGGFYTVGVGYERVDPGYATLGAYFFNSDLENITVNGTMRVLKDKVNLSANVGTQRDNLNGDKTSTMRRLASSVNVGWVPSQKVNLTFSYSNFQTITRVRNIFDQINNTNPFNFQDTLNFSQIAQNASGNVMLALRNDKTRRNGLNLNVSYQQTDDRGGNSASPSSRFYNGNLSYNNTVVNRDFSWTISANYNRNENGGIVATTLGPVASVNKAFFNKQVRTTLAITWNQSYVGNSLASQIMNGRLSGTYTFKKKHNFNLSAIVTRRQSLASANASTFTEFNGNAGYSFNF